MKGPIGFLVASALFAGYLNIARQHTASRVPTVPPTPTSPPPTATPNPYLFDYSDSLTSCGYCGGDGTFRITGPVTLGWRQDCSNSFHSTEPGMVYPPGLEEYSTSGGFIAELIPWRKPVPAGVISGQVHVGPGTYDMVPGFICYAWVWKVK